MTKKTNQLSLLKNNLLHEEQYEVMENETLNSQNFNGLTISGSLFSLTIFKNVTFESCVFFASKLENCTFVGCNFNNCTFQFSHLEYCDFDLCYFENCNWDASTIKKSSLKNSFLDRKTSYQVSANNNYSTQCFTSKANLTWDQVNDYEGEFDSCSEDITTIKPAA